MSKLLVFPRPALWRMVCRLGIGVMVLMFAVACLVVSLMAALGEPGLRGADSSNTGVTTFCSVMGLFFVWVTWHLRVHVLPLQFVADADRRECAYRLGGWYTARMHISQTTKFVGNLTLVGKGSLGGQWKWSIEAVETTTGTRRRIFSISKVCWDKELGLAECQRHVESLGEHFSLPWEVLAHSENTSHWG